MLQRDHTILSVKNYMEYKRINKKTFTLIYLAKKEIYKA